MRKKMISLLILFCVCAGMFPTSASAIAENKTGKSGVALSDVAAGLMRPDELAEPIHPDEVPEIIDYNTALLKNHVKRLYDEEGNNLNTLVFLNTDGSKTVYLYNHPVKYIDENGTIQDISLEIEDSVSLDSGFRSVSSSAKVLFPTALAAGVHIQDSYTTVKMVHEPAAKSDDVLSIADNETEQEGRQISKNVIEYSYDARTRIQYSLTYTGFKERIIVDEFTGETEYRFTLNTNGESLKQINGSYFLVDETNTVRMAIGDVLVKTADGKNNTLASIIPTTIVEGQEYALSIVLDEAYLSSESTVYPISIEPTVETVSETGNAIEDVTISDEASDGFSDVLYIGLRDNGGMSRVLMRFPGLDLSAMGPDAEITLAAVELHDLLCETDEMDVYCHIIESEDWTESTADGSNDELWRVGRFLSQRKISYSNGIALTVPHRYSFDITKAVQGWIDGTCSRDKGIMFKASAVIESGDTEKYKTIGSYNRTDCQPSISITYVDSSSDQLLDSDTYYINNLYSGNYLKYTTSGVVGKSGLLQDLGHDIRWEIRKISGGYIIRLANNPRIYLAAPAGASSEEVELMQIDGTDIPQNCVWSITMASGGGCLIKNSYNARYLYTYGGSLYASPTTGAADSDTYDSRVWRIISTSKYGLGNTYESMELSENAYIDNLYTYIAISRTPRIQASQKEIWRSVSDFVYTSQTDNKIQINSQTNQIVGCSYGRTSVTAVHKVTGRQLTFTAYISRLPIYETEKTMYLDEKGHTPEDLKYGDMTKNDLRALGWVNWTNFIFSESQLREQWEAAAKLASTNELERVALDMIDHFMQGVGTAYSNSTLTSAVKAHESTLAYTEGVEECIKELVSEYNGDISALFYTYCPIEYSSEESLRRQNYPMVKRLSEKGIEEPNYDTLSDNFGGLAFCVHGLWGNCIEVSQFVVSGNTYTCTVHYTLYDHFGLDKADVEKYGLGLGFTQWYVLQHYSGFNGAYRPFVTVIEFEETFTGTFH